MNNSVIVPVQCPADRDEGAEAFVMGLLDAAEAESFEEHLLVCAACRAAVEQAEEYVAAMSRAAQRLREA